MGKTFGNFGKKIGKFFSILDPSLIENEKYANKLEIKKYGSR